MELSPRAAFCENCGTKLHEGATICPSCGFEVAPVSSDPAPATTPVEADESPPPPPEPDPTPTLGEGETIWREYQVTELPDYRLFGASVSRAAGRGVLYVTDSRLIFVAAMAHRGRRRQSVLIQETQIQSVTGLSAYVSRRSSIWAYVLVGLVGLLGISLANSGSSGTGLFFLAIAAVGGLLIAQGLARQGTVGLRIHSSGTQASPLGFGQVEETPRFAVLRALLGPYGALLPSSAGAYDLLMGLPGPHAEQIIVELGALVADMQSKGSLARARWGVATPG
jgi:hypothetical protein